MSKLENSLREVIAVFRQYAEKKCKKDTMSKGELRQLILIEMADSIKNTKEKHIIQKILKELDDDRDDQIDFFHSVVKMTQVLKTTE
uniref:S100/CaBP-9k-type calcium binding subdomain domain-containing protein n=1 Tax=Rousettus aegyptiacus TaxID=9407 RepID=A0A7J8BG92_ROUAE|nr:hypothetical protein HJG63_017097 [Rousettus aegyptiacus]